MALFGGRPRSDGGKRRDGESIDRGTKLLAIAERQAEFAKIGIGQARQYRGIDFLGTEHLDMLRQSDFAQPTRYVDVSLQTCRALRARTGISDSSDALTAILAVIPAKEGAPNVGAGSPI